MARKGRRRSQSRRHSPAPHAPAAQPQAQAPASPAPTAPSGPNPTARRVEMSLGGKAPAPRGRNRRAAPLVQDADPGIPLDQVPYFTKDLTRLGIVALLMVVLLVGSAQLIPLLIR